MLLKIIIFFLTILENLILILFQICMRIWGSLPLSDYLTSIQVSNWRGTLHGGCLAALVDIVGSAALVTKSAKAQHSISISVNCMSAMPAGEDCLVVAKVSQVSSDYSELANLFASCLH